MTSAREFNAPFYETVATVIPVLIIALFFERGYFRPRARETIEFALLAAIAMITLAAAEANILAALYRARNLDGINLALVQVALTYGLLLIATLPIWDRVAIRLKTGRWEWQSVEAVCLLLASVILLCLLVLWLLGIDLFDAIAIAGFVPFVLAAPFSSRGPSCGKRIKADKRAPTA
jgi:hypothetical protein